MNEARTLAALGAKVRLVSKLGEDAAGEMILGRCRDLGLIQSLSAGPRRFPPASTSC